MCAVFNSLGSASAFFLLTSLLVSCAGGDQVTTQQCQHPYIDRQERVRQYPEDRGATRLLLDLCHLDEINEDDFIGLPNITAIDLDYNHIARVDLAVFRHVPILNTLHLNDNYLRELSAFTEHSCPRLTDLNLGYNRLPTVNDAQTFSACSQLQTLTLAHNEIRYIHPHVFSSLTELTRLDLSNNKLSFIPDQMMQNNKKLLDLFLYNNILTHLPQDLASSFKRAGGGLDAFYFHDNPWSCACLLELLADVQRAGVREYDFWNKYYGIRRECAYSGPAPCYRHPPSGLLPPPRAAAGGGASNRKTSYLY